jgi:hypothetical protein
MSNWFTRRRRIIGRIINSKQVPTYTYRWDTRSPATIRATGFQPWHAPGAVTLMEHVNNSYSGGPNAGQQTKHDSHWVSTGGYGMLHRLDATFAQQVLNTNLYKIDTAIAAQTGPFRDANDAFDRAGVDRPYSTQREWIKEGGIPENAIIEYMTGQAFYNQYDLVNGAPAEAALAGWQAF